MSFVSNDQPPRPSTPAPEYEIDAEFDQLYGRTTNAYMGVPFSEDDQKGASLAGREIAVLSRTEVASSTGSETSSPTSVSTQPSPHPAAKPAKKPFIIPDFVDFQAVDKTIEKGILVRLRDAPPDSLQRFEEILVDYRNQLIPQKYKGALEELAQNERAIEALKLPFKEELAQKELALQKIVLSPEDMDKDQEAIRDLNGKLKLLDSLYEELCKMTIEKIERLTPKNCEADPRLIHNAIAESAIKLLKKITAFPLPPQVPVHKGHRRYDCSMNFEYNRLLTKYCDDFDEALHQMAAEDVFEEDWVAELKEYIRQHSAEIEDDFECQEILEEMVTQVEAPYVAAAEILDRIFARAVVIAEKRKMNQSQFSSQAPAKPRRRRARTP